MSSYKETIRSEDNRAQYSKVEEGRLSTKKTLSINYPSKMEKLRHDKQQIRKSVVGRHTLQ